ITDAAITLARAVRYTNAGTFEFVVGDDGTFAFIEANPRLQVEHTVTEAVTGVDLVQNQLRLAAGATLAELGLDRPPPPRGTAAEARLTAGTTPPDGRVRPAGGPILGFEPPTGPGVRVATHARAGWAPSPRFDSLLAKVIVHTDGDFAAAAAKA